jgi:hypothetical protein
VIWPERNLILGRGLEPPKGPGLAPMSFLFPDADPAYAGYMHQGLVPVNAKPGEVTVRSPKESELRLHLENVMQHAHDEAAGAAGRVPGETVPSAPAEGIEATLNRTL